MTKLGDQAFTVIHIEDSNYEDGGQITQGVKFTTKEMFEVEGNQVNKFHTTRVAVVKKFSNPKLRDDVNNGKSLGPIKCITEKTEKGKDFFNLIDA